MFVVNPGLDRSGMMSLFAANVHGLVSRFRHSVAPSSSPSEPQPVGGPACEHVGWVLASTFIAQSSSDDVLDVHSLRLHLFHDCLQGSGTSFLWLGLW